MEQMMNDSKLLIIVMFIFILANWYLLVFIIARGFKRVANEIEDLKEKMK